MVLVSKRASPKRIRESANRSVISLFSGAMGFDLGLERAGLKTAACVEFEPRCCETIRTNRPGLALLEGDIRQLSTAEILRSAKLKKKDVFAIVGGPPCQSFSSGGKRASILDPRGSLFMDFVRVIREADPHYFVFENVAHIVTAAVKHRPIAKRPGKRWNLSSYSEASQQENLLESNQLDADELSGSAIEVVLEEFQKLEYCLSYGVLNAADFGVPQKRLRFVLIGSRGLKVQLPLPTHGQHPVDGRRQWRVLTDALSGLREHQPRHSNYSDGFREIFERVPPGGNWRALPLEIQRKALGAAFDSGGGKTGFFRRLAWNEPAPTIVGKPNRKSCALCHPDFTRPLSVREAARIQGFPDDWEFAGGMHDQYLQIGNAVPVGLGEAVGRAIIAHAERQTNQPLEHDDTEASHTEMLQVARDVLRASARNRVAKTLPSKLPLLELF